MNNAKFKKSVIVVHFVPNNVGASLALFLYWKFDEKYTIDLVGNPIKHVRFIHGFFFSNKRVLTKRFNSSFPTSYRTRTKKNQGRRNRWSPWSPGFTGIQRFYYREIFSILDIGKGKFFVLHRKKARSAAPVYVKYGKIWSVSPDN